MNSIDMRRQICKLYPYDKWRQKVKKMTDEQVLAIYLKYSSRIEAINKAEHYEKIHNNAMDAAWGYYGQE